MIYGLEPHNISLTSGGAGELSSAKPTQQTLGSKAWLAFPGWQGFLHPDCHASLLGELSTARVPLLGEDN